MKFFTRACLSVALFSTLILKLNAQTANCNQVVFSDNFSTNNWQSVISNPGQLTINNGALNYNGTVCSTENRVYKSLNATLSNNYWKAETEFVIYPNASGNGVGANVIGLAAGNQDLFGNFPNGAWSESNQDALLVNFLSASPYDGTFTNWYFNIIEKKGTVRSASNVAIATVSGINKYYIRLERTSSSTAMLSIFSDAAKTIHIPGSPITHTINSTITGLNTIHHGASTQGWSSRVVNGSNDNDFVCQAQPVVPATNCGDIVFTNDFSSNNWQSVFTNASQIGISNGKLNFNNTVNGYENRIYKPLGATLSNNYWKAETDFVINPNTSSGSGVGASVIGLAAGSQDLFGTFPNGNWAESNQDALLVNFASASPYDGNFSNWYFNIIEKKGTVRVASNNLIYAVAGITKYYVRLERTSNGTAMLSVFSDSLKTMHISGSPVTHTIDTTIMGLNTIHHGASTQGWYSRMVNGSIDNDLVCQALNTPPPSSTCGNSVFTSNFSTNNWQLASNGQVNVANGTFNFNNTVCGYENRAYKAINATLSNNYWKAQTDFSVFSNSSINEGTGVIVMAISAGNQDYMGSWLNGNYTESNQDALAIVFSSTGPYDGNFNNWYFTLQDKLGSVRTPSSALVMTYNGINKYYLTLERTSSTTASLSVFIDSLRTIHAIGSPISHTFSQTLTGLNTIQHGSATAGWYSRIVNGKIDNDLICQGELSSSIDEVVATSEIINAATVYPNPSNDVINVLFDNNKKIIAKDKYAYTIIDLSGKKIEAGELNTDNKIAIQNLKSGVYLLQLMNKKSKFNVRFIKQD